MFKSSVQKAMNAESDRVTGYITRRPQYEVLRRVAINSTTEEVWEVADLNADPDEELTQQHVFRKINGTVTYAGAAL